MRVLDSRRVRGRSLGTEGPAAVAEVALEGTTGHRVETLWRRNVARAAEAVGRPGLAAGCRVRAFEGGLSLVIPSPLDVLLAVVELNDWALEATRREVSRGRPAALSSRDTRMLRRHFEDDARPALVSLVEEAQRRGVAFVIDDDALTLGLGAGAESHALDALPPPSEIEWAARTRIPVAFVTGTNGKTTTTRLVARMVKHAGLVPGNPSTDGVTIDERIEEPGDWTGAEAARRVLRDPRVQLAILETARGGILRRGLAIDGVDAALVTNVAADHLGEYGVHTVEDMARTKLVVTDAVRPGGKVVLPEHDEALWPLLGAPAGSERVLFSDAPGARVAAHLAAGGHAFVREDGALVHRHGGAREVLAPIADVPVTFGGRAPHNVKNALAAAALAWSLGLPHEAITAGLRSFGQSGDNPGRGELVTLARGARVLTDFGHNAAAMRDLLVLGRSLAPLPAKLVLVTTIAGDRSDAAFDEYAQAIAAGGADEVIVWEKESLLRGRRPGETTGLLGRAVSRHGVPAEVAEDERAALVSAVHRAGPEDLVVAAPYLLRLPREDVEAL